MFSLPVAMFFAQDVVVQASGTSWEMLGQHLVAALIFSFVGVIVFFGSLLLMEKLTPFSIIKEIGEEHNTAVAMIVSAIVIGISLIIAAAIMG
ncbi:DUF350 domain-containing protein [Rubripirellula amarantea]|uniref:DUF350 domain-containing protein n=1 Tax=Rubripirellula amarantea TaxID=2527999 RepID=A0A5C5WRP2_9BACT|nr:DUF350 domain-containing protein [Rubripirellula amarantea]MDA8746128.1 DUF350 domain-containing protein [Rubripirellula amarantea]TWT53486.1 hypothetical protein Pla22_11150 [Rubripirellula amarantea]